MNTACNGVVQERTLRDHDRCLRNPKRLRLLVQVQVQVQVLVLVLVLVQVREWV